MPSEQSLVSLFIDDFSAGLMSEIEEENIPLNGSPDCLNVKAIRAGELLTRFGWAARFDSGITVDRIDGHRCFKDAGGNMHEAVWVDGNLYEWISGSSVTIASAVYQAGQKVASFVREGILFFSDGITFYTGNVGCYYWDPTNGATPHAPIGYTPDTARVPFPAFKAAAVFNGSALIGNVHAWGYDPAPSTIMWSDPQFTDVVLATDIFPVDKGYGGAINSIVPLALVTDAETPLDAFFVGKEGGVYLGQGPLTVADLKVPKINCIDGVLDPASVQYVGSGLGSVVFLGTGKRVWITDGLEAREISKDIKTEMYDYITQKLLEDPAQRFSSARIWADNHYLLDVGGDRQYALDWNSGRWWRFEGWPSGLYSEGDDPYQIKPLYCVYVEDGEAKAAQCNTSYLDDDALISAYWKTPDLRGAVGSDYGNAGDKAVKRWYDCFVEGFVINDSTLAGTFTPDRGLGSSGTDSVTITGTTDSTPRYDTGVLYDSGAVYGSGLGVRTKTKFRKRLEIMRANSATGANSRIHGTTLAVKLEQTLAGGYMGLYGLEVFYQPRKGGRGRAETI
jgi:hypothetical protein